MSFSAHRRKITTAVMENILFLIYCNIKYIYSLHQMARNNRKMLSF